MCFDSTSLETGEDCSGPRRRTLKLFLGLMSGVFFFFGRGFIALISVKIALRS